MGKRLEIVSLIFIWSHPALELVGGPPGPARSTQRPAQPPQLHAERHHDHGESLIPQLSVCSCEPIFIECFLPQNGFETNEYVVVVVDISAVLFARCGGGGGGGGGRLHGDAGGGLGPAGAQHAQVPHLREHAQLQGKPRPRQDQETGHQGTDTK